jgi:hypothetical protein
MPIALGCAILLAGAIASSANDRAATSPVEGRTETSSIVQRMVESNKDRADRLPDCTSRRHYHLQFHGLGRSMEADMEVEVLDHGSASRTFQITAQSGSHVLLDHVLKKLLKSEEEAYEHRNATGLTPENYSFALIGNANEDGRQLFILQVEPKTNQKLLYRGRIWVDAKDYAVVRIEAQPAENPSFWIRSTEIHHVYAKVGDFWLPQRNVSESHTRFGGTATLTIDYGDYEFERSDATSAQTWSDVVNFGRPMYPAPARITLERAVCGSLLPSDERSFARPQQSDGCGIGYGCDVGAELRGSWCDGDGPRTEAAKTATV